ncbi:DNA helicase RecQ [Alicyclobacillus dauci]|uniref:DNA helicase RecQ n=1 Tax=Alicyclobacillus dauci TaxID=1475485 RepID=A0ABY6Z102_9BACL|nr:DNA helicase RecQ [Alicyclobacillus dauci]WAH36555.1 DNA helicase RecQ [Alicyclobacillus dauci]
MSTVSTQIQKAAGLLQKYFGYERFRPGQEDIVASILSGQDTIGIMPTGGGKSICYQIPALMQEGLTVVVSPLISLMKDQVDTLDSVGINATYINSSLSASEAEERLNFVRSGACKLLYVAPERLESASFRYMINRLQPSMFAIDEAHCLSQWGHDFRPSYRAIAAVIDELDHRPLIAAFTATATPAVVSDIADLLDLVKPAIHVTGFDRENLSFAVIHGQNKRDYITAYLKNHPSESGVIYASTRKEVDSLYEFLHKKGFLVGRYHAGLSDDERMENQERFLFDDVRIMIATNAFGMGIDKSNIRFVLHHNMPKNIEAYYQEAGRAGRDGDPGECILLYSPQDVQVQKFLIEQTVLQPDRKRMEYERLQTMVDYCHMTSCLRAYILRYFGEEAGERCDNCSNCKQDFETRDITIEAQKIFSCVHRTKERFGMKMIAAVLRGSSNQRVRDLGLNKVSTFGLMADRTEKDIMSYLQTLVADGYLRLTTGQYPVVRLQEKAVAVLKGEVTVLMRVVRKGRALQISDPLFEELRALRREIAERENVPPYVVFADSTLREMASVMPTDISALRTIKGVGDVKVSRYGTDFLRVIRDFGERHGNDESASVPKQRSVEAIPVEFTDHETSTDSTSHSHRGPKQPTNVADETPSHIQSFELFQAGKEVEEISSERGLSTITIEGHLIRCAQEGHPIDWARIFSEPAEAQILTAIDAVGSDKLKPIKEALPDDISYFMIRAVIAKHGL